ncbi:hypothetical protein Tco_0597611 [Tanacetum coccineum]
MTKSLTKELVTPYKEPERVFRSSRKLSRTRSLDYLSLPEFNLFFYLEEHGSDTEDANEHIEKVLEIVDLFHIPDEVISLYKGLDVPTRQILNSKGAIPSMKGADARKAIQDMVDPSQKWHNGMSTRTRSNDTSAGLAAIQAQLNNLRREIKKVNKRMYVAQFGVPFPQGGRYRAAAPRFYQRDSKNPSYQERRQTMEESLSKFMAESAKRHDENYNLIKEIQAATDTAIRNQGTSIKALEIQIGYDEMEVLGELMNEKEFASNLKRLLNKKPKMGYQIETSMNVHGLAILEDSLPPKEKDPWSFTIPCYISNICFEKALADLGASVSVMLYTTFTNLGLGELAPTKLIIELADRTIKHPKGIAENVSVCIDKFVFPVEFIVLDMPEDIKVLLILE